MIAHNIGIVTLKTIVSKNSKGDTHFNLTF